MQREVDTHPLFMSTIQHKAFVTEVLYPDAEATEDYWTHLMCGPVFFKNRKGTNVSQLLNKEVNPPCYIYAVGPNEWYIDFQTTLDKPLFSLEDMAGFIVFELREGSTLSDYWQQRAKSQLCCARVTPRKTHLILRCLLHAEELPSW